LFIFTIPINLSFTHLGRATLHVLMCFKWILFRVYVTFLNSILSVTRMDIQEVNPEITSMFG